MAVPLWARDPEEGLVQSIRVVDVVGKELKIFAKTFPMVELREFNGGVILGEVSGKNKVSLVVQEEDNKPVMLVK